MTEMFELFPSVLSIADPFEGVLLDAYGVFWGGNAYGLFPGSAETMAQMLSQGKVVGILSNTTQLAEKETTKLEKHGLHLGQHFHFLITSGEVARSIFLSERLPFATPHHKFWMFGEAHPRYSSLDATFAGTVYRQTDDIQEADFIYIAVPHINGEDQVDPELFREEVKKVVPKKLPMLCPNPDKFAHEGNPPKVVVRQGSIARLYKEMGGEVFYIGKPHEAAFTVALEQFRNRGISQPKKLLMVGDTPETDIQGANQAGMASALIVKTGIMAERISHVGLESAFKDLPPEDLPTYVIERF
ncbi:MAG: TIGR01459 family HAD-type hydrolase [Parachlamydiaceae bacterium]